MNHEHRPDDEPGEAWEPEDESGPGAWDDGSEEVWDGAEETGAPGPVADVGDYERDGEAHTALPPKVEAWRRRSATGAILTGFAFGLQQVFETKDEPAVIMETSGDPPKDLPVEAELEYGRPRHSVVNIRPWLLPGDQQHSGETPPGDRSDTGGRPDGEQQSTRPPGEEPER